MENKDNKAEFRILKNGPIEISGKFTITGSDKKTIKTNGHVYLCRCGASGNKPLCDETHISKGFHP